MLRVHRVPADKKVVLTRTKFKSNSPGTTANSFYYKSNLQVGSDAPDVLNVPLDKQTEGPLEANAMAFAIKTQSGARNKFVTQEIFLIIWRDTLGS